MGYFLTALSKIYIPPINPSVAVAIEIKSPL